MVYYPGGGGGPSGFFEGGGPKKIRRTSLSCILQVAPWGILYLGNVDVLQETARQRLPSEIQPWKFHFFKTMWQHLVFFCINTAHRNQRVLSNRTKFSSSCKYRFVTPYEIFRCWGKVSYSLNQWLISLHPRWTEHIIWYKIRQQLWNNWFCLIGFCCPIYRAVQN